MATVATAADALPILELPDAAPDPIATSDISLDTCPPRCAAVVYARANPSVVFRPVEPDEIVFEGDTELVWGDAEGERWTIWGRRSGPLVTVWDDSMWIEDDGIVVLDVPVRPKSLYSVSAENRILPPSGGEARGVRVRTEGLRAAAPTELSQLDDIPAELLTPAPRSAFAEVLERVSKSRYAVGAVTLLVVVLMARLAR
ncbi:MAG: hypothetical protein R3E88_08930 [Myxococcota bacterium]